MTPTLISIINQSTQVSDNDVSKRAEAISIQLSRDVEPIWGQVPAIEFVPKSGTPSPGGTPAYIQDEPDIPNALGYHDENASGPFIKVFVTPTLASGDTVSSVHSHEC